MRIKELFQKNRVISSIFCMVLAWIVLGLCVWFCNDATERIVQTDGTILSLSEENNLSQRMIGNDEILQKIRFGVVTDALPDDALLDVFLTKGNTDCVGGQVLQIDTFKGSDLKKSDYLELSYDDIKLSYLCDYYINFGLSNAGGETLGFHASYDAGDAYVYHDDVNYGCSMAYQASYLSCSTLALFWWRLFGVFVLLPLLISIIFRSDFWRSVCYTIVSLNIVLFVLGVTKRLDWIYSVLCTGGIVVFLLAVLLCVTRTRDGKLVEWDRNEHSAEKLFVWIVILAFLCWRDNGLWVSGWDETYHWSMAVKDIYLYNLLPPHPLSSAACYAYPPGMPLLQWFFVILRGNYDEGVLYLAVHVLEAALFFGMLEINLPIERAKRILIYCSLAITLWGLPEILQERIRITSLGIDVPLGFATALLLFELFRLHCRPSKWSILWICMTAINMCLLKDNGMIHFVAILSAFLIADLGKWFFRDRHTDCKGLRRYLVAYGLMAICVWFFRFTWNQYVAKGLYLVESAKTEALQVASDASMPVVNHAVSVLQRSGLTLTNLVNYLTGKGQPYQYEIILKHLKILFLEKTYFLGGIPTSPYMLVLLILCVSVRFFLRKEQVYAKHTIVCMTLSSLACATAYQLVYTFVMTEQEARVLYSEQRYMGSFLLGLGLYVVALLFYALHDFHIIRHSYAVCGLILVILILTGFGVNLLRFPTPDKEKAMSLQTDIEVARQIRRNVRESDRVYFVDLSNGHDTQPLRYWLTPVLSNEPCAGSRLGEFYTHSFMPDLEGMEPFEDILSAYDYVFVRSCDDAFLNHYGGMFEEEVIPGALYHVNHENSGVTLTYIANCRA